MSLQSPLHELTRQAGARFGEWFDWEMPTLFNDLEMDYSCALGPGPGAVFDLSHHGEVELRGPDASRFLHNLCTNDILKLAPGQGCEAFLTNAHAKILGYISAYRTELDNEQVILLDTGPGQGTKVVVHLERYLISEHLEIRDRTADLVHLHLAGAGVDTALDAGIGELADFGHRFTEIGGVHCHVRRRSVLGMPSFDVLCARERGETLWKAILAMGFQPAGLLAFDVLRMEAGSPLYGLDIDESNLPQEVARNAKAISFTKGCYIGQETVARIHSRGHVNRQLVGLAAEGSTAPLDKGTILYAASEIGTGGEVGRVTSAVDSPRLKMRIGLGYVRRGSHEPGTRLEVRTESTRFNVVVSSLPFTIVG